jgi:hypothetical protein
MDGLTCVRQGRPQMTFRDDILPHGDLVMTVAPLGAGSTTVDTLFRNSCSEAGIDTGLAGYISLSVVPPKNALSDSLFTPSSAPQKSATHYPALFSRTFQSSLCPLFLLTPPFVIYRLVLYPISPISTHPHPQY